MLPRLAEFTRAALDLLFPQKCLGCGKEGAIVCPACLKRLTPLGGPVCPRCGRPQSSPILCPSCVVWDASLDSIRSPLSFEGLTRRIVHQFKYKNIRCLVEPLSFILKDYLIRDPLPVEVVVPVPLHPRRLKERGYNQSALLGAALAKLVNLPLSESELQRVKYILPQARTHSVQERRENVRGAFKCSAFTFPGKAVLLIDDVATSGATLNDCARALKEAGSGPVFGLVLAREI